MAKELGNRLFVYASGPVPPTYRVGHVHKSTCGKFTTSIWNESMQVTWMGHRFEDTAHAQDVDQNVTFGLVGLDVLRQVPLKVRRRCAWRNAFDGMKDLAEDPHIVFVGRRNIGFRQKLKIQSRVQRLIMAYATPLQSLETQNIQIRWLAPRLVGTAYRTLLRAWNDGVIGQETQYGEAANARPQVQSSRRQARQKRIGDLPLVYPMRRCNCSDDDLIVR